MRFFAAILIAPLLMSPLVADEAKRKIIKVDEKPSGSILKIEKETFLVDFSNHQKSPIKVALIDCMLQRKEGDTWVDMRSGFRDARIIPTEKIKTDELLDVGDSAKLKFCPYFNHHHKPLKKDDTIRLVIGYWLYKNGEKNGDLRLAITEPYKSEQNVVE